MTADSVAGVPIALPWCAAHRVARRSRWTAVRQPFHPPLGLAPSRVTETARRRTAPAPPAPRIVQRLSAPLSYSSLPDSYAEGARRLTGFGKSFHGGPRFISVADPRCIGRSEEHTSELQSLRHLVCRLLLE